MKKDRRPRGKASERDELEHRFEGREILDELLAIAGSPFDSEVVVDTFRDAQSEGDGPSEVFSVLFDGEPLFPSVEIARRLFQNLFGLWDLVASGETVLLDGTQKRVKVKKEKLPPPEPFGAEEPSSEFVDAAWRFLEEDERTQWRLNDAFENRQDALLTWLDAEGFSDEGYVAARQLLFELFAMLELGLAPFAGQLGKPMVGSVDPELFTGAAPDLAGLPDALREYIEEALLETDLADEELAQVREKVQQGALALWNARVRSS